MVEVIRKYPTGALATVKDGKPWVRHIGVSTDDDLHLVAISYVQSRKVDQIKKNRNVHIAFGLDPQNEKNPFINVEANAEVRTNAITRQQFWQDAFRGFFSGPDDPNYAVIKITPARIEYYGSYEQAPEVYLYQK
ncbi:MAG: pyridoxamine 5'-phosphate oxidase family protein [PVC group bacterium]